MNNEIQVKTLEPFEIDPGVLAQHLERSTPWWRWIRRRRLRREIDRLTASHVCSHEGPDIAC